MIKDGKVKGRLRHDWEIVTSGLRSDITERSRSKLGAGVVGPLRLGSVCVTPILWRNDWLATTNGPRKRGRPLQTARQRLVCPVANTLQLQRAPSTEPASTPTCSETYRNIEKNTSSAPAESCHYLALALLSSI